MEDGRLRVQRAEPFLGATGLSLHLETTRPATLTVDCTLVEAPQRPPVTPRIEEAAAPMDLTGLKRDRELTITACSRPECHPPASLGISHPVGVRLKNRHRAPDLPTLEGGIITCVTCHKPHSSRLEYLAQMELSKKICLTCHTEFNY